MRLLAWPTQTTLNPYASLVYSNLGPQVQVDSWPGNLSRKYSVWHVHWPDSLLNIRNTPHAAFKVSGLFAATDFMRARGTKLIWTMHNFASHESLHPKLESWFWRQFIPRVDGVISLSNAGLAMGLQRFPRLQQLPSTVIRHGHYRDQYPPPNRDARALLGIPQHGKVMMFFGAVRAYKNVDTLVKTFRSLPNDGALLYVVGQPNSVPLSDFIKQEAAQDPRIFLKFEWIDSQDVSMYLSAADLVVLPYREVLNSGSALLALSCDRPILVPDLGAMGELKLDFSTDWVRTYKGPLDASILEDALLWSSQPRPAVCPMPDKYCWDQIGKQTLDFYQRVMNSPSPVRVPVEVVRQEEVVKPR
jgi:beta-1,4-mannosyltransferase